MVVCFPLPELLKSYKLFSRLQTSSGLKSFSGSFVGKGMRGYETKIISTAGTISLQISGGYASDFAAIRAAQKLCATGECAEVWRDDVCIYASERATEPAGMTSRGA